MGKLISIDEFDELGNDAKLKSLYYGLLSINQKITDMDIQPSRKGLPWYWYFALPSAGLVLGWIFRSIVG